jgi:hypothetical protein
MTIWIPKGEFPAVQEDYRTMHGSWEGNILAYRTEIRQQRVIHLENLYRYMYYYLNEEGWFATDGTKDWEVYYMEHRDQHEEREEIKIWWRLIQGPGFGPGWTAAGGITSSHPFFRYSLNIDFLCYHVKRIEMMHEGRKIKPYIGDVTIYIAAVLELDYHEWMKKGGLLKILKEYFIRRIYKRNIREHELELRRLATRYSDDFKHFIGLARYTEDRKLIQPAKGFY